MNSLGRDIRLVPDIDETGTNLVEEGECLAQDLAHRLETPRGSVEWLPDYGYDLRQFLNRGLTRRDLLEISVETKIELEKDPRVNQVTVNPTFLRLENKLRLEVRVEAGDGPHDLVFVVDPQTVVLISTENL